MAETKRVYEIRINGIQESYEGVKSLSEVLNGLSDVVVNVTKEEEKSSEVRKSTTSSTDALAKAQEKLNNYDKQYQEELAKVNASLSANKKEINDAIKLQQAQDTVDAKQLDTYAQKQQYLTALNTLIRNHTTATDEDVQAIDKMVQESAALQAELKATDEQMKIYVRNVGNYNEAADKVVESHKSVKSELKDLKAQMADMLANGVSKTDAAYLQLAERAGHLKDAIKDANEDITNFASDTRGMTNAINLAQSAVGAYQLYNSTMELFGQGNEEAAESMKKMMAVMTVLNSLQQVQNSLLENGSATARLYNKAVELVQAALGIKKAAVEEDIAVTEASTVAEEANTVANELNATASEANATSTGTATAAEATNTTTTTSNTVAKEANTVATNKMSLAQKAGAVASNILSVALKAIPLMAVIGLVMALIQNWESIWNWFKKTFPVLDTLSKKFNKFGGLLGTIKTACKAFAAAVVNWLINPIKTFANVISKVLSGDFAGAMQAAMDGIKNQFKGTADAFKAEVAKGYADAQEEMTRKAAAEEDKRLTHHNNMLTNQKKADGTYRKEYIEDTQKMYDNRKKMYKKDSDEYKKVLEDEAKFHQQVEDAKTSATQKGAKARSAAAKAAAAQAKKDAEQAKKEEEQRLKEINELIKKNQQDIQAGDKLWLDAVKRELKIDDETMKQRVSDADKLRNSVYKTNLEHERRIMLYKSEIAGLKLLKQAQEAIYEKTKSQSLAEDIEKTTQALNEAETAYKNYLEATKVTVRYGNKERDVDFEEMYKLQLDNLENDVDAFYAKRTEIAVNSYLYESVAMKKSYKDQIEVLEKNIKDLESKIAKERDKTRKERLEQEKADAEQAKGLLEKALKALYAQYANEDIHIPVDLDLKNAQDKYRQFFYVLELEGKKVPFTLQEITQAMFGVTDKLSDDVRTIGEIWDDVLKGTNEDMEVFAQGLVEVAGLGQEQAKELYGFLQNKQPFDEIKDKLVDMLTMGTINLNKFGKLGKEIMTLIGNMQKEQKKASDDAYKDLISKQDKIISNNEKIVKNFQQASRDIKFEPAMKDDALSGLLKGQIIDLDKTRERYDNLESAYQEYVDSLDRGSEQMKAREDAWQTKLEATKQKYGENSMEYKLMLDEKAKSDAAYEMEYEKAVQNLEDVQKKQADLMYDYIESIAQRTSDIIKTVQENVLNPIFDGLGDLFAFQLEEAQEALDEITALYDKAVEAREESAERMKEINDELRNDDGQNKEALQQRLAEEEVLLVQREEAERALQKEKEKREKEVQKKEAQQRVLELSQKLVEGIANTALGATAALKYGFPLGPVFAAIIAAMGAVQTAIIAKQIAKAKSQMATGGKIGEQGVSRSHQQGGHRIEGTNIEVEGQEWVINKKSSQKYDTLLRAINEDNLPLVRKQIEIIREKRIVNEPNKVTMFASGGQINTLTATRAVRENNEVAALTELVKAIDFAPTVSVVDINRVNKRLVRVQDLSGKAV